MNIKEIIQRLRTAMDDARGEESHFQSWLTQNEGICDAIDALKELDKTEQEPCGGCGGSGWVTRDPDIGTDQECFVCGGSGAYPKEPEQEPVAAECKFDTESMWLPCAIEHHHLVQSEPHKWPEYQTRLLYTTPPPVAEPHKRKPLTAMEVYDVVHDADLDWHTGFALGEDENRFVVFARAIEAAHGIKGEA